VREALQNDSLPGFTNPLTEELCDMNYGLRLQA
jgi:uncharacterized protein YukJ